MLSVGLTIDQIRRGEDPGRAISFGTGTFLGYRLTSGIGARLMSMPNPLAKLLGFGIAVGGPFLGGELGTTGYDLVTQATGLEAISGDVSKDISTSIEKIKQNNTNVIINKTRTNQPAPFGAEGRAALIMFAPSFNRNNMYVAFSHIQYNVPMV